MTLHERVAAILPPDLHEAAFAAPIMGGVEFGYQLAREAEEATDEKLLKELARYQMLVDRNDDHPPGFLKRHRIGLALFQAERDRRAAQS